MSVEITVLQYSVLSQDQPVRRHSLQRGKHAVLVLIGVDEDDNHCSMPCTAIASGILLANAVSLLPFPMQDAVKLRIHELIPLAQMFALAAFIAHAQLPQNSAGSGIVPEV